MKRLSHLVEIMHFLQVLNEIRIWILIGKIKKKIHPKRCQMQTMIDKLLLFDSCMKDTQLFLSGVFKLLKKHKCLKLSLIIFSNI